MLVTVGVVEQSTERIVPVKASERQVGGSHYKDLPIQPGIYIRKNGLGWYEGNIVKYITRHTQKGGREDIEKVIHYAQLLLEEYDEHTGRSSNPDADDSNSDHDRVVPTFKSKRKNTATIP